MDAKNNVDWLKDEIIQIQNDMQILRYILTNLVDSDKKMEKESLPLEFSQDIKEIRKIVTKIYGLLSDKKDTNESPVKPTNPRKIKSQITFRELQKMSDSLPNEIRSKTTEVFVGERTKINKDRHATNKDKEIKNADEIHIKEDDRKSQNEDSMGDKKKVVEEKEEKKEGFSFSFFK